MCLFLNVFFFSASGEIGDQTRKTMSFVADLKRYGGIDTEMYWWDETRSSAECAAVLRKFNKTTYEQQKPMIDQMAATLILQNFLSNLCKVNRDISDDPFPPVTPPG